MPYPNALSQLPRPVAFVLSGGTALGAIQVGMLRALHERGIAPDLLVGTSVGALNAAFVAGGYTAQRLAALAEIWRGLRSSDVFGTPGLGGYARTILGRGALASTAALRALLQRHFPASQAELALPMTAVATDLLTGAPILLGEGPLRENLLASAAIPGVFPPLEMGGRVLVDGGVAAHVPVAPARELGARTLFVLDTGYPCTLAGLPRGLLPNLLHVLSLMLRHQSLSALTLAGTDCTVVYLPSPCPLDVAHHDFSQAARLIETGYTWASRFLEGLEPRGPGVYGHPHFHATEAEGCEAEPASRRIV